MRQSLPSILQAKKAKGELAKEDDVAVTDTSPPRQKLWELAVKYGAAEDVVECFVKEGRERGSIPGHVVALYRQLSRHVHGMYQVSPLWVDVVVSLCVAEFECIQGVVLVLGLAAVWMQRG